MDKIKLKQQALEAAREYSHNMSDLLSNAAVIEQYLCNEYYPTAQQNSPVEEPDPKNNESPIQIEDTDDVSVISKLANDLVSDLGDLGYVEPTPEQKADSEARNRREDYEKKWKENTEKLGDLLLKLDPNDVPEDSSLHDLQQSRAMENFVFPSANQTKTKLRPVLLLVGEMLKNNNMIINTARQSGMTTMIAAFVRQQRVMQNQNGNLNTILVITNNYRSQALLYNLIDDASVSVDRFSNIEKKTHAGEKYDYIVVMDAAFIPYASEERIQNYITLCSKPTTKFSMISTPGESVGWFHHMYTGHISTLTPLAIDWRWYMSGEDADNLRMNMGDNAFENQYENKFRPISE